MFYWDDNVMLVQPLKLIKGHELALVLESIHEKLKERGYKLQH